LGMHRLQGGSADWDQRAKTLAELELAVIGKQVVGPPREGPADVIGGFDLAVNAGSRPPAPNWSTAPVLAFLADTLADEALAPKSARVPVLVSCGLAARFLGQLMFDEPSCFYVRSKKDALGGIRPALWDNTLSL